MVKLSQKEAVYKFVCETLGKDFRPGQDVARTLLSSEQIKEIRERMLEGFGNGTIPVGGRPSQWKGELQYYANNIVHNWLRKDPRLKGGQRHRPIKNLARIFDSDPVVKMLKEQRQHLSNSKIDYHDLDDAIKLRKLIVFLDLNGYPMEELPKQIAELIKSNIDKRAS